MIKTPPRLALHLATGQVTVYHIGDDATFQKGLAKRYEVHSTGPQSGTTNVDSPEYAAPTIAFVSATKKITDTGNRLATFKTGDTIIVKGSASNPGPFAVATGNVAGEIVTTEALTDELAGAYMTICKRVAPSNNTVYDLNTGLTWLRYTTGGPYLKCGPTSIGDLVWYDATKAYVLHAAGADLQMVAGVAPILRIVGGAGEIARYFVGATLLCSGFANAVNNLPGPVISAVAVNGADLDLTLNVFGQTLIAEAAAGSRDIKVVCQSMFSYCAMANAASLGGFTDWRIPTARNLENLEGLEAGTAVPNTTAFPSWPASYFHEASGRPGAPSTNSLTVGFSLGDIVNINKVTVEITALVRG